MTRAQHVRNPISDMLLRTMVNESNKKILYVITKSEPFGGAQKYVHDLATNLTEGFEPLVAFGSPRQSDATAGGKGTLKEALEKAGVETISIPHLARDISLDNEVRIFFDLLHILKDVQPDVVHLNSSKIGGLGALAVRVHNLLFRILTTYYVPRATCCIFTAHGWPFKEERPWWQTALIRLLSWITVLFSHRTIVVSEDDKERAEWMPFVQKKIHVIRNGAKPIRMVTKTTARRFFRESGVLYERGNVLIGMIGELTANKGYRDAIHALKILVEQNSNIRLVVMGDGEEYDELNALIAMKELTEHVFLLGNVPDAAKYLHGVDLFLLSSHKEGLPYVLVEAGHAALPVVATAVGGVPEVIGDMRSGILVRPHRPQEIADALAFLLDNPEHQRTFGDALHEKVRGEFSFKKMLEKTLRLYN